MFYGAVDFLAMGRVATDILEDIVQREVKHFGLDAGIDRSGYKRKALVSFSPPHGHELPSIIQKRRILKSVKQLSLKTFIKTAEDTVLVWNTHRTIVECHECCSEWHSFACNAKFNGCSGLGCQWKRTCEDVPSSKSRRSMYSHRRWPHLRG